MILHMAQPSIVMCPSCGKRYAWKPELANKKVVCKGCQGQFRFPTDDPGSVPAASAPAAPAPDAARGRATQSTEEYEIEAPAAPRALPDRSVCPNCAKALATGTIICSACGWNLQTNSPMQTVISGGGGAPRQSGAAGVWRIIALIASGFALLGCVTSFFFGYCCFALIPLSIPAYNIQGLLRNAFDQQGRIVAIIINILGIGAGLAGIALAIMLQLDESLHVQAPPVVRWIVIGNAYSSALAMLVASASVIMAVALYKPPED